MIHLAAARAGPAAEAIPATRFVRYQPAQALHVFRRQFQPAVRAQPAQVEIQPARLPVALLQVAGAHAPIGIDNQRVVSHRAKGEARLLGDRGCVHGLDAVLRRYSAGAQKLRREGVGVGRAQAGAFRFRGRLERLEVDGTRLKLLREPIHRLGQLLDVILGHANAKAQLRGRGAQNARGRCHLIEAAAPAEGGAMPVVHRTEAVEREHDGVEVVADEAGARFAVDAVGGDLEARQQTFLRRGGPGAMHRRVHHVRRGEWLAAEEMNVERAPARARGVVRHPVHAGRGQRQVHLLAARSRAKTAVGAGEVAGARGNQSQERRVDGPLARERLRLRRLGQRRAQLLGELGERRPVHERDDPVKRRVHQPLVEDRNREYVWRHQHFSCGGWPQAGQVGGSCQNRPPEAAIFSRIWSLVSSRITWQREVPLNSPPPVATIHL